MTLPHLMFAVLVAFSAGVTYSLVKFGVDYFPPIFFGAVRYILVGIFLVAWWRMPSGSSRAVTSISIAMTAQYIFMFTALSKSTDTSSMALVHQLYIPFATMIASLIYKEKVGLQKWFGMGVSFCGVAVIGFEPQVFAHLDAFFLAIAAAFCGGMAVAQGRQTIGISVLSLQFWVCVYGVVPMCLISLVVEEDQFYYLIEPEWPAIFTMILAALFGAVLAQAGRYYLVQRYPVSLVAPIMLLTPVFAVLSGVFVNGDEITLRVLIGGLLVIGGLGVMIRLSRWTPEPRA